MPSPSSWLNRKHRSYILIGGAKSLPPVKTGDTVRLKTKNDWKPATVTKLAPSPRLVIVTSKGTSYRRNRRDIKTPDSNTGTITSATSDKGITKFPESDIIQPPGIIRTRSGRTVQPPRLNDFVYY